MRWPLLLLLLATTAGAASRRSTVLFTADIGNDEFAASRLESSLAISPRWALIAQGGFTHSASANSGEGAAGADYLLPGTASLVGIATYKRGPEQLNTLGATLEGGYWLNRLWDRDAPTIGYLNLGITNFNETARIARIDANRRVNQLSLGARLSHELLPWWVAGGGASFYLYDRSPEVLSSRINNPRFSASGLSGAVSGFPLLVASLKSNFFLSDVWTLELSVSHTRFVVTTEAEYTTGESGALLCQLSEYWMVGTHAAGVHSSVGKTDYSVGIDVELSW